MERSAFDYKFPESWYCVPCVTPPQAMGTGSKALFGRIGQATLNLFRAQALIPAEVANLNGTRCAPVTRSLRPAPVCRRNAPFRSNIVGQFPLERLHGVKQLHFHQPLVFAAQGRV